MGINIVTNLPIFAAEALIVTLAIHHENLFPSLQ